MNKKPSYLGHRSRIRKKFLNQNSADFYDYEILELLLFSSHPRKDVKPLAKKLLERFRNLKTIISSSPEVFREIEEVNDNTILILKLIKEINVRILKQEIANKTIISDLKSLINYAKIVLGNLSNEQFHVIFLDKSHNLIADEIFQKGSIENVMIDFKEIAKKALIFASNSIILMHNHPSGNIKPSKSDIINTNKIIEILNPLNIKVIDHIIIGKNQYFSFKNNGLI